MRAVRFMGGVYIPSRTRDSGSMDSGAAGDEERNPRLRTLRLLLWHMIDAKEGEREKIRTQLASYASLSTDFLTAEACSPSSAVRLEALKILEGRLPSDRVEEILPLLYDYSIDVRDQARRTIQLMVPAKSDNGKIGGGQEEDIESSFATFEEVLKTSNELNMASILELLFGVAVENPDKFWSLYAKAPERVRSSLTRSFLLRNDIKVRKILFLGLLCEDFDTVESARGFLERTYSRELFQTDVEAVMTFNEEIRRRVLEALDLVDQLYHFAGKVLSVPAVYRADFILYLREINPEKYSKSFADALGADDTKTVMSAINVALVEDMPGLATNAANLLRGEDPEIVEAAARYLGRHGDRTHVKELISLLDHESVEVGQAAVESVYSLTRAHLLENYEKLNPTSRSNLANLLAGMNRGFALGLTDEFRSSESDRRRHIIAILQSLEELDDAVQEALRKMSDDPDSRVRSMIAKSVGQIKSFQDRHISNLKLLYDEDPRVRANAVEGLMSDTPEHRERVEELAVDGEPRERANAIRQLFFWKDPSAQNKLHRFIGDPSSSARLSLAWLLGEIALPEYESLLWRLVKDENPAIRTRAIKSLQKVASEERVREIIFMFQDTDVEVRRAAREAVRVRLNLDFQDVDSDYEDESTAGIQPGGDVSIADLL